MRTANIFYENSVGTGGRRVLRHVSHQVLPQTSKNSADWLFFDKQFDFFE